MTRKFDKTIKLKENAMLKVRPDLFDEWNFEKNDELGFDIYKITRGNDNKVWWICPDCKSDYDVDVGKRVRENQNCPYCSGSRVNHTNSLEALRPDIASEWHPTLNGNLTPRDYIAGSNQTAWWICEHGHEWKTRIAHRAKANSGCPVCSGQKFLKGFNDIWATDPELASWLANPEDGYKYSENSSEKLDWKCPSCKRIIKNKTIRNVKYRRSVSCSICSTGRSYGERLLFCILEEYYKKEFVPQKMFDWARDKRYDFYLPEINTIIEVHGIQHYEQTSRKNARTLEEEQANDKLKYDLAKANGIEHYIVIDARYSDLDWIKNSIKNSELMNVFNSIQIDWKEIQIRASKPQIIEACSLWNKGFEVKDIAEKLKLSITTIRKYLRKCEEAGLCIYNKGRM